MNLIDFSSHTNTHTYIYVIVFSSETGLTDSIRAHGTIDEFAVCDIVPCEFVR
jgi:hypothetical protein